MDWYNNVPIAFPLFCQFTDILVLNVVKIKCKAFIYVSSSPGVFPVIIMPEWKPLK